MRTTSKSSIDLAGAWQVATTDGWLADQPVTLRERLLSHCQLVEFAAGDRLFSLNGPPGGIFGIVSGFVSVLGTAGPFDPMLVFIGRPGFWAGEAAAAARRERRVELVARNRVQALHAPLVALERLIDTDPAIWRAFNTLTAMHFDNALFFAFILKRGNPRQKIAATLVRLAGAGAWRDVETFIACSQSELGELAGLSRNSVGPVLRHLDARGLVRLEYRRILYNPARLRAALLT